MALTTVNTDGITDGTIKNIDVKSDAAIDGSKINPDFGSQNIVTTGNTGIGAAPTTGYQLQVTGQSGYDDIARITAVGTNMGPRINFTPTGTGTSRINATANNLALQTGGTTGLTIDTSGNTIASGELFADDHLWMVDQLRHTGDTDTAIRFPTADTISFETAGETRLKIDSDGRLLQNITAIGDYMHQMEGAGGTGKVPAILFKNGTASANEIIGGWTAYNTSNQVASIYAKEESANDDAYLQFSTRATGASLTERLRIHSDGEVEIKEAAEGQTVLSCTAAYANSSTVDIQTWARSDSAVKAAMKYSHGTNSIDFGTTTNHPLILQTNNTEAVRITSGGSLQVKGDANPNAVFDRGSANTTNVNLQYNGTLTGQLGAANGEFQISAAGASTPLVTYVNGEERLRITSTGKLIISPNTATTAEFDYAGVYFTSDNSTVAEGLFINNIGSGTGGNASISFSGDSGNRKKSAISHVRTGNYGRGDLTFSIDPDADSGELDVTAHEKLRITSAGRVLIGCDSSSYAYSNLVVEGNATFNGGTGGFQLQGGFTNPTGGGSGLAEIRFTDANESEGAQIKVESEAAWTNGSSYPSYMQFKTTSSGATSATEKLRITSAGQALFSGLTTNNDSVRNVKGISLKSTSGISFEGYGGSHGSRNWRIRPDDMHAWGALDFAVSPTADDTSDWPNADGDIVLALEGASKDVVVKNGNLKIGTNGKGIDFGATSDVSGASSVAEIFDSYEEGTFTPSNTSSATLTYTYSNQAKYTLIGNYVYFHFDITFPINSDTNSARFSSPLYTSSVNHGGGVCGYTTFESPVFIHVNANGIHLTENKTNIYLTNAQCSGKRFIGQAMYPIT